MTEEKILSRLCARDPRALEQLMDRYTKYVSAIVWNILRSCLSVEDGEEVVSDVFLAAWERAADIRPDCLKAWLGAVARNKARDRLRKAHQELPLEEDILELTDENTPVTDLELKEERMLVRKAVDSLGEPDREIFLRHYYYIQPIKEICLTMGLNESTVKTKLRRGRMRLKTILTRWGVV